MKKKGVRPSAKPRSVKLLSNIRIRAENREHVQKRAADALYANQIRQRQSANQFQLELARIDNALQSVPTGLQRDSLLLSRGEMQKKHDGLKIA
jgi:hypothetical protein